MKRFLVIAALLASALAQGPTPGQVPDNSANTDPKAAVLV